MPDKAPPSRQALLSSPKSASSRAEPLAQRGFLGQSLAVRRLSPSLESRSMQRFTWLTLALFAAAPLSAQELSILPEQQIRLISEEISGDAAYAHVRHNSQFHRPRGGSDGLWKVAQYYEEKAREYGLADVKLIKQAYGTTRPWNARVADLWIAGDKPERIASTVQTPLHLADFSRSTDTTAELIDIGAGSDSEIEGKNVHGKIVLTYGAIAGVMERAVAARGAAGIVWH